MNKKVYESPVLEVVRYESDSETSTLTRSGQLIINTGYSAKNLKNYNIIDF